MGMGGDLAYQWLDDFATADQHGDAVRARR